MELGWYENIFAKMCSYPQLLYYWDDSLPGGLLEGWTRWKEELLPLNHLSIPRCYFSGGCSCDASFELHHFSDASEYGYGTVCYLRKESGDRPVGSTFIMAKSHCAFRAILGNSLVDEEVLATVLTEVEAILNSQPLCAASDDPDDQEPLTPNHLLLQKAVHNLPPGSFVKEDLLSRKKWRQAQILADHFWKRWLKEYILSLQERQKWQKLR